MSRLFLNLFLQLVSELVEVVPLVEEAGCQVRHLKGLQSKDLKESLTLIHFIRPRVLQIYIRGFEPIKIQRPPYPPALCIFWADKG